MKKLIILMSMLIGMISYSFAQTTTKNVTAGFNKISGEYVTTVDDITFNSGDTVSNKDTLHATIIFADYGKKVSVNCEQKMNKVSGTTTGVITTIKGKVWSGDSWTSIVADTNNVTGTNYRVQLGTTTGSRYRYFAVFTEVNTTGKILITDENCKFYFEQ
jgi:hypothetical protein